MKLRRERAEDRIVRRVCPNISMRVFGLALPLVAIACAKPALARVQFGGTDFQVNSSTLDAQWYPAVTGDPSGNFVVVWTSRVQDPTSLADVVGKRLHTTDTSIGSEFVANAHTTEAQTRPVISNTTDGAFVAAWVSFAQDGDASGIFARLFDVDGVPVGDEFQVNEVAAESQLRPAIAANNDGSFMVVWYGRNPPFTGDADVFGRIFDSAGSPRTPEFQVNTYTSKGQFRPKVCGGAFGEFVVVWQSGATFNSSTDQDGSGAGVFGRRFDSAGTARGDEFQIPSYTVNSQIDPALACGPEGEFLVVWSGFGPSGRGGEVFARAFTTDAVPAGLQVQLRALPVANLPPTELLFPECLPQVARAQDGVFLVAWADRLANSIGTGESDIVGQFVNVDDGRTLGSNFVVTTYTNAYNSDPKVSGSGDGFVVAWTSGSSDGVPTDTQDGSGAGVFARTLRRFPECGDATDDGAATATDALIALEAGVGSASCATCVCDTDSSGDTTATDALAILQNSVGLEIPLACTECE